MEMRELDATNIGQRITISYPGSGSRDQVTGVLTSVTHKIRMDRIHSEIEVRVADQTHVFPEKRDGKWALDLRMHPAS